jgi:DNA-binding MarR family transcriptional regulator
MYSMGYDGCVRESHDRQPSFETGTGFLLARLGSLAERSWVAMLRERNLTAHQHGVLLTLREHRPLAQHDLARMIAVDPRNIVPIIDGLVEKGLIDREMDPADRRRRVLTLTDAGSTAAAELATAAAGIEDDFLASLTPSDRHDLARILRVLHASMP